MPTGYTADIHDGKDVSLQKFVLTCARNFGALIMMRDDPLDAPIPEEFNPSDWNRERLTQAKASLTRALKMSDRKLQRRLDEDYCDTCKSYLDSRERSKALRSRYEAMLVKVRTWAPPSPDHEGLKSFMIEQIEESIKWDCSTYPRRWPRKKSVAGYRRQLIATAKRDIAYHSKAWAEEVERAKSRTTWIKQLRESLQNLS